MPVPKPRDLAGADEAALHPWTGQEGGIALGKRKRVAEDLTCCGRRWK
jgi:hypothetical protein